MDTKSTIIPVAGGKGGVGKSLVAANLSIALAQLGHSTVVIDLDLGGSNLHLMLGRKNENRGIGDYLNHEGIRFEALCVQTEWPQLRFIPGDGTIPFLANISYAGKQKIIREIKKLNAKYIILDLGAGTSLNTLDFFHIVNRGLLVTATNRVSVINMLAFLKNYLLRIIDRELLKDIDARLHIQELFSRSASQKRITIDSVIKELRSTDTEAAEKVGLICQNTQPRIVHNLIHDLQDLQFADIVKKSANSILSLDPSHFGAVFADRSVPDSIREGVPLLQFNRESIAAQCIFSLASEIVLFWDGKLENTEQILKRKAAELYGTLHTA